MSNKVKLRCVWYTEECSDDVKELPFFNQDGIKIPVCSLHIESHNKVIDLCSQGYTAEEAIGIVNKEKDNVE